MGRARARARKREKQRTDAARRERRGKFLRGVRSGVKMRQDGAELPRSIALGKCTTLSQTPTEHSVSLCSRLFALVAGSAPPSSSSSRVSPPLWTVSSSLEDDC